MAGMINRRQEQSMGNLYQLYSKRRMSRGETFLINGPYDKYGIVLSCAKKADKNGDYLVQIRGTGLRTPSGLV